MSMSTYAAESTVNDNLLPDYSQNYDAKRDPFKDGHDAIALAQKTHRRILIEVGGNWCKWCHVMDRFFTNNPDIHSKLHQAFVILKINVSDENDNQAFLSSFPRPLGYPHMYISETNGELLASKDTAEFMADGKYSRQKFLQFINHWAIKKDQQ